MGLLVTLLGVTFVVVAIHNSVEAGCPKVESLTCLSSVTCSQLELLSGVSGFPLCVFSFLTG